MDMKLGSECSMINFGFIVLVQMRFELLNEGGPRN